MDLFSDSWKEKDMPDLTGKVFLVTGSTDGLGLAASKEFAKHNAHVILTYRDPGKLDM
jgi:NAD(P)-dependent dehydrogenase (short-subunit alcohol dehydrogenase family)